MSSRVVSEFPVALEAINRVLEKNKSKDTTEPWAKQSPSNHWNHAICHCLDAGASASPDCETNEHPAVHAVTRLLMYLELIELERLKNKP
ncbi:MAG: hypothetical protein P8Z50_01180 [candidate division WOR-3 bacterium]|jgi:hypothetical protein